MASDSEQTAAPSTVDGCFNRAPSIGRVPAKRTRNFHGKKPAVFFKSKKASSESKSTQQLTMKPPAAKQTKSRDNQFSSQRTTLTNNLSDQLYEDRDDNNSLSDVEFPTMIDDNSRPKPVSRTSSSKARYKRPLRPLLSTRISPLLWTA